MDLLESERAQCAVHAGAQSTGTCARCGNFVCPLCLDPDSFDERCESCRAREGAGTIPWERTSEPLFGRFAAAVRGMLLYPGSTLERAEPGSLGRALAFNVLLATLVVVPFAAGLSLVTVLNTNELTSRVPGASSGLLVFAVIFYSAVAAAVLVGAPIARGLAFHVAARLLGGSASVSASVWVTQYVGACQLFFLALAVTLLVPIVGPILMLVGVLAIEAFWGVTLTLAATRYHGLTGGRAALAGWVGFLAWLVPALGCCGLSALLAEMVAPVYG